MKVNKTILITISIMTSMIFLCHADSDKIKQEDNTREEKSFTFPASLNDNFIKDYSIVIKNRLEYISKNKVSININNKNITFSFSKKLLSDDEIELLDFELLRDLEFRFHEVQYNTKDKDIKIVISNLNREDREELTLTPIERIPFLTLTHDDILLLKVDSSFISDGIATPVLRISIKKADILEKTTETLAINGGGAIYFIFNEFADGCIYVHQKISNQFTLKFNTLYPLRFLEMQYKYPLPKRTNDSSDSKIDESRK